MKIRFANTAKISLYSAINFIQQDNPTAAVNFLERVEKTLRRLEKHPDSGRRIPEFPGLPYRELLVLPYRFFYKNDGKTIFIVAPIKRRKYKLEELVSRITDENIHNEDIWGPAFGREVW